MSHKNMGQAFTPFCCPQPPAPVWACPMIMQKHGTGLQRSRMLQNGVLSHESHDF
jgi:hypothetical protein